VFFFFFFLQDKKPFFLEIIELFTVPKSKGWITRFYKEETFLNIIAPSSLSFFSLPWSSPSHCCFIAAMP